MVFVDRFGFSDWIRNETEKKTKRFKFIAFVNCNLFDWFIEMNKYLSDTSPRRRVSQSVRLLVRHNIIIILGIINQKRLWEKSKDTWRPLITFITRRVAWLRLKMYMLSGAPRIYRVVEYVYTFLSVNIFLKKFHDNLYRFLFLLIWHWSTYFNI